LCAKGATQSEAICGEKNSFMWRGEEEGNAEEILSSAFLLVAVDAIQKNCYLLNGFY
jgi:hypothetical protein